MVTSPTGAAIRDFLQVLGRRWRGADVLVVPVRVQGEGAAAEIAAAIETRQPPRRCRSTAWSSPAAAAAWKTSGRSTRRPWSGRSPPRGSRSSRPSGHEIDVTLSDLVADVRALTPSEAAELVAPAAEETAAALAAAPGAWRRGPAIPARGGPRRLDAMAGHRGLSPSVPAGLRAGPAAGRAGGPHAPGRPPAASARGRQQADSTAARLDSLSPLAVLGRGYSLTQRLGDGRVVRDASELSPGEAISTRFARGQAISRVERIE